MSAFGDDSGPVNLDIFGGGGGGGGSGDSAPALDLFGSSAFGGAAAATAPALDLFGNAAAASSPTVRGVGWLLRWWRDQLLLRAEADAADADVVADAATCCIHLLHDTLLQWPTIAMCFCCS